MRKQRKVGTLVDNEYFKLKEMMNSCPNVNAGRRAHAIILSSKGYSLDELSDIFDVDRDTISIWLTRWEENGITGLYDEQRPGRPPIASPEERSKVKEIILENPRSLKTILDEVKKN